MALEEARLTAAASAHDPLEDRDMIAIATPRQLMWWKFRKHRVALISVFILAILYLLCMIFPEFVSHQAPNAVSAAWKNVPPQAISFIDPDGNFSLRPGVYGLKSVRDPETLRRSYEVDPAVWHPLYFFTSWRALQTLGYLCDRHSSVWPRS